jgi:hypothetical protein
MITQREIIGQASRISELSLEELRQALTFCYRHISDQDELISTLTSENRQWLERYPTLEDELTRREEERDRYKWLIDWTCDLFRNKTIPQACKLVLWYFHFAFFCMRPETTGSEMRIGVETTAEALGVSKGTVRRATDKAENCDVLKRRYEDIKLDDGGKMTLAHITLSDIVVTPKGIVMEKAHGGERHKICPRCKSEQVDRYTVQYCRCCNKNDWYGQPGNRNDADVSRAQHAENMPLYKNGKIQDGFGKNEQDLPTDCPPVAADPVRINSQAPAEQTIAAPKIQDEIQNDSDQAHHILPAIRQLDAEHTSTKEHGKLHFNHPAKMEQHVMVCHASIALNKDGKPAHGLEKVKGHQECGSTQWQWSAQDGCRVCKKCWTPAPDQRGSREAAERQRGERQ